MVLSYPELPADVLAGRTLKRKKICRTFSDCTTAPRNGIVSGCFPLDPFYKERPEADELARIKRSQEKNESPPVKQKKREPDPITKIRRYFSCST